MNENFIDKHPLEKEAMDIILGIKDEFENTIPEKIFVERYLPFLANKEEEPKIITEWIKIAGHVYSEVKVVDEKGKFLFKVPSIFNKFKTKEHKHANQSVKEIIENSKLYSINSPKLGERVLIDGLHTTLPEELLSEDDDVRWDAILKKYGYPTLSQAKKNQNNGMDDSEDTGFDEYDLA